MFRKGNSKIYNFPVEAEFKFAPEGAQNRPIGLPTDPVDARQIGARELARSTESVVLLHQVGGTLFSLLECEFELGFNWKVVDLRIPFPKHIFKVQSEHRGLRYDFSKKVSPYFHLSKSATPLTLVLIPLRLDLTLKLLSSILA